ncbi:MAG TPA: GLUG motif-containing protein, partial [Sedimentisphaerales bacterium]|nr:GLUG motif-containing protein [Sedimentisphaerales bacterium]HNU27542.1 GLUG motif-containing protein [Sedimentisphaerales bacterium]
MVTRCTSWAYVAAVLLLTGVSTATAQYSGGTGEPNDPYQIATAADLIALGETPEDYDKHFLLTADIDLDPNLPGRKVFDKAVIAPDTIPGTAWDLDGTPFVGVFDGKGHTILHLTITGGSYVGLFGGLASGGEIKDLGVTDVNVTGDNYVSALVGYNDGTVSQCYSTGAVGGGNQVGGLVGHNAGGVHRCFSTGTVWCARRYTGGPQYFGGLVGSNAGAVTNCYSTSPVRGPSLDVGGLVGINFYGSTVTHCYSTGVVQYVSSGGLVGRAGGSAVVQCFWDTQTSGQITSAGGLGKTMAEMQDIRTYLDAGWDFVGEAENGTTEVWQMPQGGGYPVLAILSGYSPPPLQGQGTPDDPYLISDARELGAMTYYNPRASYRLVASIDLSGIHWGTAVIPWFSGSFEGASLTISHLTIQGAGAVGLFGRLGSGAEVKNLGLVDVNVSGSGHHIGSLAGSSDGTLIQCYAMGTVAGESFVGGLVGTISYCPVTRSYANVIHSYSTASVRGAGSNIGGLVGGNFGGDVTQSYSSGTVSGGSYVGGLVGLNGEYFAVYGTGGLWKSFYRASHIDECHATGGVTGDDDVGGLVGFNGASPKTSEYPEPARLTKAM